MPRPIGKPSIIPFETIEAPSHDAIQSNRVREELFHLERTISNSCRDSQVAADAIADLTGSVDKLVDSVNDLNKTAKEIVKFLKKFEKVN